VWENNRSHRALSPSSVVRQHSCKKKPSPSAYDYIAVCLSVAADKLVMALKKKKNSKNYFGFFTFDGNQSSL